MNIRIPLAIFASFSSLSMPVFTQEMMYTSAGYPYDRLVKRTDSVKLIYTERDNIVDCRAIISKVDQIWSGFTQTVTEKEFQKARLSSCLSRKEAKSILRETL